MYVYALERASRDILRLSGSVESFFWEAGKHYTLEKHMHLDPLGVINRKWGFYEQTKSKLWVFSHLDCGFVIHRRAYWLFDKNGNKYLVYHLESFAPDTTKLCISDRLEPFVCDDCLCRLVNMAGSKLVPSSVSEGAISFSASLKLAVDSSFF